MEFIFLVLLSPLLNKIGKGFFVAGNRVTGEIPPPNRQSLLGFFFFEGIFLPPSVEIEKGE